MLVGIVVVIAAVLNSNGGFMQSFITLSEIPHETVTGLNGAFVSFLSPKPLELLGVVLLTSLGTWGLPQMVGKFYAIKNEAAISKGTLISTIFAMIVAGGCYFLGGFGRLYGDVIDYSASGTPVYDSIVPSMLSSLPDWVIAIVIVLVLSASMSTLSSLVLTSSSTLTLDMIVPLSKKNFTEKQKMLIIRALLVVFIVISAAIAIIQAKSSVTFIAQLMGVSWGALAGAFLAPYLYSLYSKKVTRASVWVSFIAGVSIMTADLFCNFTGNVFISPYFTSPINAGVLAMVVGLILVPIVNLFTKKPEQAFLDDVFSCYNQTVTVQSAVALADTEEDN